MALLTTPALATEHRVEASPTAASELGDTARTLHLRYRFEATNTEPTVLQSARLQVWMPVREDAGQALVAVTASHPFTLETDRASGNTVAVVDLGRVPPRGIKMVSITAEVAVVAAPRARELDDSARYLAAEPLIEADAPAIAAVARRFGRGDAEKKARAAYDWVVGHVVESGYLKGARGALWALESGEGDCTEMAYLFVALCRAAGVPARFAGGWVVAGSSILEPAEYHNWAEYHDGTTWRVVDPQKRIFDATRKRERFVATHVGLAVSPDGDGAEDEKPAAFHRYRSDTPNLDIRMLGVR